MRTADSYQQGGLNLMSTHNAMPNSWTVVDADAAIKLTYAPQVYPSPLRVSLLGSVQIVITNPTSADLAVQAITFSIPVGQAQDTLTGGDIHHRVSDSAWKVTLLDDDLRETTARYLLGPATGDSVTLAAGASVVVQFYGFQTHDQPGTATIGIKELTTEGTGFARFTVTTFPWGFTFSNLAANVHDGSGWKTVAQVDNGSRVTLTWQSSVAEITAYQIYCSTSEGQSKPYTPDLPSQWTSPKLTMDTVFTVVVNPPGLGLTASMSTVVAVENADVRLRSLTVGDTTLVVSDGTVSIETNSHHAALEVTEKIEPGVLATGSALVVNHGGVGITGNHLSFGDGTHTLVVDRTNGSGVTGGLSVTGGVNVADGIKMDPANGVIQRGDSKITTDDLGLYSNNPTNWIRLVTNNSPIKCFTDGGGGTNPVLTINEAPYGVDLSAGRQPSATMRLSSETYTGFSNFDNNAEISNDINASYGKALMLNGNSSRKPGGPRWVQVWDNLEVKGNLYVFGEAQFIPYGESNAWCTLAKYDISRHGTYWQGRDGPGTASDLQLKRDVQPVQSALDKVRRLCGVTFHWNEKALEHFTSDIETTFSAGPNATEPENQQVWQAERDKRRNQLATTHVGVVAQDVEAVLPEAVTTDPEGYKSVRYDNLIPLLIEAIKEQDQLAARQQREIDQLKLALRISES
jgi:hypothetical protein